MTTLHKRPADTEHQRRPAPSPTRDPRVRFAATMAPLFLIASGLLAWWASDSITDHQWGLDILSGVCALLFVVMTVRAIIFWRRARR
ncbi:hypothetical protein [Actinacidiphila epipremni]|uniref:Uncharacterized protein n=1 Tax=Actinacidiphila epipremni TaxID=2053013 RepID=A0ABX0ZH69_9ACTN|nr:hypothetical protein [Actinacidiphila epipremni]NJP43160.1 hypothetical protein [Actinacidiphila epipremni]